jgi:hypothetical protein
VIELARKPRGKLKSVDSLSEFFKRCDGLFEEGLVVLEARQFISRLRILEKRAGRLIRFDIRSNGGSLFAQSHCPLLIVPETGLRKGPLQLFEFAALPFDMKIALGFAEASFQSRYLC